jgi:hypothetical protein
MFSLARPPFKPLVGDSIVLYRGTVADHERGMAWTTCPPLARWFAGYWIHTIQPGADVGCIYQTTALAAAVLCETDRHPGPGRRSEHEVIVNPHLLGGIEKIDEISPEDFPVDPRVVGCSYVDCTCIGHRRDSR